MSAQRGQAFLEALVVMPAILLLLAGCSLVFDAQVRSYRARSALTGISLTEPLLLAEDRRDRHIGVRVQSTNLLWSALFPPRRAEPLRRLGFQVPDGAPLERESRPGVQVEVIAAPGALPFWAYVHLPPGSGVPGQPLLEASLAPATLTSNGPLVRTFLPHRGFAPRDRRNGARSAWKPVPTSFQFTFASGHQDPVGQCFLRLRPAGRCTGHHLYELAAHLSTLSYAAQGAVCSAEIASTKGLSIVGAIPKMLGGKRSLGCPRLESLMEQAGRGAEAVLGARELELRTTELQMRISLATSG